MGERDKKFYTNTLAEEGVGAKKGGETEKMSSPCTVQKSMETGINFATFTHLNRAFVSSLNIEVLSRLFLSCCHTHISP